MWLKTKQMNLMDHIWFETNKHKSQTEGVFTAELHERDGGTHMTPQFHIWLNCTGNFSSLYWKHYFQKIKEVKEDSSLCVEYLYMILL